MQSERITAFSTAVIAFGSVIGLMVGFYYNLKTSAAETLTITISELLFIFMLWVFIM